MVPAETKALLPSASTEASNSDEKKSRSWIGVAVACFVGLGWILKPSGAGPASNAGPASIAGPASNPEHRQDDDPLHKSKKKVKKNVESEFSPCDDGHYSKRTLKLAYELPFGSLFRDNKGQKKYEASDVILVDDNAYAVHDSSWAISKFTTQLQPFTDANIQLGDPLREDEDSGYEALLHEDGVFYVVRESVLHDNATYHAIIEELVLGADDYELGAVCPCEFEFEGDSKGFEGAVAVKDLDNEMVVLGLCEGNHCSESRKNDKGNGKLVAMRKKVLEDGSCQWSTIRTIDIPESAFFKDYSAIALNPQGRVVITSQEESQVWFGNLVGKNEDGLWDIAKMEFSAKKTVVYDFPKNDQCQTIFCNVEGIHWINDEMLMAVSDKMKSKGKQDFRCFDKDQSVHVFVVP